MNVKDTYDAVKKKYTLPDFEDIDHDFEISYIDHEAFFLREVRRKMVDKMEYFLKILEEILQPETTISNMHECKIYTDSEKEELYNLFRQLMIWHRNALLLTVESNDKSEAEFVSGFAKEWKSIKPLLLKSVKAMRDSWSHHTELKEDIGYMG